jgi:phage terminase large subunit GpA-like protein
MGLKPDPIILVSEWADQFRILPNTVAEPGKFRTSRTPYLKEIMDKLSVTDKAQKVVFKKCSQIGATESGNNWLGYVIDIAPNVMIYVMPTDTMMKNTSTTRIQPMINNTPALNRKINPARSKDGGNTMLKKEFAGGFVLMVGANSPVGLSSTAARFLYLDEVDRYPMDVAGEGDAIALAETRTSTFGARRKIFISSTPTIDGASIIDNEFKETGQRYYHVPCPDCGTLMHLKFDQLRWEPGKYSEVYYECEHCGGHIKESSKTNMLSNGQWIALFPELEDGITFGYHLNALYSPSGWYSWAQMAREYDKAKDNLPKMITFINTKKGETYKTEGDSPEWEAVFNKREKYAMNQPNKNVVFLTAGVDIQRDRVELEIVGWAKGKQSWSIDFRVLLGSTDSTESPVWNKLAEVLNETWIREDGAELPVHLMAVDSGFNTSIVYDFARKHTGKVIPIKGQDNSVLMVSPPRAVETSKSGKKVNGIKVWNVGSSMIKTEIYGWLKLQQNEDGSYPNGYCHFPEYDRIYFKGLTAEKITRSINKKGYTVYTWEKHYERNEPLDCRVYARAAANVFGIDRFNDKHWDKLLMETLDTITPGNTMSDEKPKKKPVKSIWNR